jgi:hypothetical protein
MENLLLWAVAGVAAILILQYILRAPSTPDRPQGGLGKRFPVGPRRLQEEPADTDFTPERPARRRASAPVAEARPQPERPVRPTVYVKPRRVEPAEPATIANSEPAPAKARKRTDTMQAMLNKAIAERR